jgi:hypothetical protein
MLAASSPSRVGGGGRADDDVGDSASQSGRQRPSASAAVATGGAASVPAGATVGDFAPTAGVPRSSVFHLRLAGAGTGAGAGAGVADVTGVVDESSGHPGGGGGGGGGASVGWSGGEHSVLMRPGHGSARRPTSVVGPAGGDGTGSLGGKRIVDAFTISDAVRARACRAAGGGGGGGGSPALPPPFSLARSRASWRSRGAQCRPRAPSSSRAASRRCSTPLTS